MSKIFPWRDLLVIMGVAILSGITVLPLFKVLNTYFLQLAVVSVVYIVLYLSYGYLFKIYTQGDIDLIRDMLGNKLSFIKNN